MSDEAFGFVLFFGWLAVMYAIYLLVENCGWSWLFGGCHYGSVAF